MSSSHQVRSTTASLLLGIVALVVVLPSAALWGSPSPTMFDLADRTPGASEMVAAGADPASDPAGQDASDSSGVRADVATELHTVPWQSPFSLLLVLAAVVGLRRMPPVRPPVRRRDRVERPVPAEVHAAVGLRGPPSAL